MIKNKKILVINVWDWVITNNGKLRQITSDDMQDLKYEDIKRLANKKELKSIPRNKIINKLK